MQQLMSSIHNVPTFIIPQMKSPFCVASGKSNKILLNSTIPYFCPFTTLIHVYSRPWWLCVRVQVAPQRWREITNSAGERCLRDVEAGFAFIYCPYQSCTLTVAENTDASCETLHVPVRWGKLRERSKADVFCCDPAASPGRFKRTLCKEIETWLGLCLLQITV